MPFPDGQFIVFNRDNHRVLDDSDMSTRPGTAIVDYDFNNRDNQHWMYRNGRLYNAYSNLILTFKDLRPESLATQEEYSDHCEGQIFEEKDGIINVVGHKDRVVGAWGRDVKIVTPDPHDPARRWDLRKI